MSDHMKEAERLIDAHAEAHVDFVLYGKSGIDEAFTALLAHIQRGAVPDGWQLVPKEPTPEMQFQSYMGSDGPNWPERLAIYKAMLAAAPPPDQFRDAAKMMAAPAEVPMPECYVTSGGRDLFSEEQMRTYGDTRAAAGYARCLREMLDCRTCWNYTRDGCIQTAQCVDGNGYRRATPVRFWSATMRGEVK